MLKEAVLQENSNGAFYHRLVARGMKERGAMMAVMRKMLLVASRLLRTGETYGPKKVGAGPWSGGVTQLCGHPE
jgi:hypothetical protein